MAKLSGCGTSEIQRLLKFYQPPFVPISQPIVASIIAQEEMMHLMTTLFRLQ